MLYVFLKKNTELLLKIFQLSSEAFLQVFLFPIIYSQVEYYESWITYKIVYCNTCVEVNCKLFFNLIAMYITSVLFSVYFKLKFQNWNNKSNYKQSTWQVSLTYLLPVFPSHRNQAIHLENSSIYGGNIVRQWFNENTWYYLSTINLSFSGKHSGLSGSLRKHVETELHFHRLHKNFGISKSTAVRLWLTKAKVNFLFIYTMQSEPQFENCIMFLVLLIIQRVNITMDLFPSERKPSFKNLPFISNWFIYEKIRRLQRL